MSHPSTELQRVVDLRVRAASRLAGAAAAKGQPSGPADALAVLHALASSPATAPDALALLHELQVHQVELELQAEELQASRTELESTLRRQLEVYDAQPVACFTIDAGLVIHQLNLHAAGLLGIDRDEACGAALGSHLGTTSLHRLRELLTVADRGAGEAPCQLTVRAANGTERQVRAHLGPDAGPNSYLLVLTPA